MLVVDNNENAVHICTPAEERVAVIVPPSPAVTSVPVTVFGVRLPDATSYRSVSEARLTSVQVATVPPEKLTIIKAQSTSEYVVLPRATLTAVDDALESATRVPYGVPVVTHPRYFDV